MVDQVDLHAEEMGNNVSTRVPLLGDLKAVITQVSCSVRRGQYSLSQLWSCFLPQLNEALKRNSHTEHVRMCGEPEWWEELETKVKLNLAANHVRTHF